MRRITRREFGGLALALGAQSRRLFAANTIDAVLRSGLEQRMALLGVAASAVPARRALTVNPSRLMRQD